MRPASVRRHGGVVQRIFDGLTGNDIEEIEQRCHAFGPEFARRGVRHVESIVIPGDDTCLSVFEGPDAETVRAANTACQLPTGRVLAALLHSTDSDPGSSAGTDVAARQEKSW